MALFRLSLSSCLRLSLSFRDAPHAGGATSLRHASTLSSILNFWTEEFTRNGVSEPSNSAELILAHVLGRKTLAGTSENQRMSSAVSTLMTTLAMQRMDGIPLQYVIGEWDFRHLTLQMQKPIFIPRPETENLVDLVLNDVELRLSSSQLSPLHVLEIGCGSGAISLSLLRELDSATESEEVSRAWTMSAIDINKSAVELTARNAKKLQLEQGLRLRRASIGDIMKDPFPHRFSVAVSNPPYIPSSWLNNLPPDVSEHEDHTALFGGEDGADILREIIDFFGRDDLIEPGGSLWLEIESSQPEILSDYVRSKWNNYVEICAFHKDFRDVIRFVELRKN